MHKFCIIFTLLVSMPTLAQQNKISDYPTARELFWQKLYRQGGESLYCAVPLFTKGTPDLNLEHVYPMAWVTRELDCGTRRECRRNNQHFNHIEADLHNLYPSRMDLNDERGNLPFGMVKGEQRRFGECDFEIDARQRIIEPRPAARGEIARAMFYMADSYQLKIFNRQAKLLNRWHREDPPDAAEHRRNDLIEQLQGTRNPYIDEPERSWQSR